MIKSKDFRKAQELIIIRDTAQRSIIELNLLSEIIREEKSIELKKMIGIVSFIESEAIDKLDALIDWSEEE